ncbi:hypothetical protein PR048_023655 [Dryococelus australis]|uniref:Uncharacterized protein n=1 Tax=Dryococelus australis TaxID=614101 RepID=A0ABQ9GUQ0_9NEOP|nr:hypothetical protein PR048_023655 [Dryococelus australis]
MNFLPDFQNRSFKELDRFKRCCHQSLVVVFEDKFLQGAESYKNDLACFLIFEMRITILEADMEIRPFTKVSIVSCGRLQTGLSTTKHYSSVSTLTCLTGYNEHSAALLFTIKSSETYLQSTMTEDRLNGLALLHIHQDIAFAMKPEEVLAIFARKHKIKLSLNFFYSTK